MRCTYEVLLCSSFLSVKMDFDYQKIKDAEALQREERFNTLPIQYPRPLPRSSITPESQPTTRKPPVKPRRSIKCHPAAQPVAQQSYIQTSQKENESTTAQANIIISSENEVVKRIAPSQVLGPAGPLEAQTPSLRAHILLWFQRTQLPRLQKPGCPLPRWLHGFATRREAEMLLQDKQQGYFLLRLSESKVGFVLSYRGADRCRHFIIEEESEVSGLNGQYVIAGEQSRHSSLDELISYYTHNPVGPFNETLTVPCVQSSSTDEIAKLGVATAVGRSDESGQMAEGPTQSVPVCPATGSASQVAIVASDSVQYAVVRKVLKKSHSLSECTRISDTMHPSQETDKQELSVSKAGDLTQPTDAPYARVKKPPRAIQRNPSFTEPDPDPSLLGAAASIGSFPSAASIAEQKYWELEPLHTYEETPHTRTCNEEIDPYATGRRREIAMDAGDLSGGHLYSEVNIKGIRDDLMSAPAPPPIRASSTVNFPPSSTRLTPSMPFRPPPRHAAIRPDSSVQNFGNISEPPQPVNSDFSIYEQIPERPPNSRPPLPPPNPKR